MSLVHYEAGSDYTPVLVEGVPMCFYEMEK